tara:strand:+ start:2315 stop:2929 length:615 start_codon:yes stop_codon:yes gene_type:complete
MLKKIKVYGRLKKFLKWDNGTFEADVKSFADVMSFLKANWPEVKAHMAQQHYKIMVADRNLDVDELHDPIGQTEEIKIVPVMVGAKGSWTKIIAGIAIVGLVVATGGFGGAMIGTFGLGTGIGVGTLVAGIGVSLMLGGVSQLLADNQEQGSDIESHDPNSNYQFSGVNNISRSGVPLPLIYGYDVYVGSIVISNGIDTVQAEG